MIAHRDLSSAFSLHFLTPIYFRSFSTPTKHFNFELSHFTSLAFHYHMQCLPKAIYIRNHLNLVHTPVYCYFKACFNITFPPLLTLSFDVLIYLIICAYLQSRRLTTGWTVRDRIPGGTRFSACPDRPWGPPSLL